MEYLETDSSQVPMSLLLEADPSEQSILSYLDGGWCFVAKSKQQVIAACIVKMTRKNTAEVFNVSVSPEFQKQGIGSVLMQFTLSHLAKKGVQTVELGTGTFGYQLTYYQRLGFRVGSVVKDHFLDNYPDPIYENGIQHKDMLRLYLHLEP
ncbi:GNAT family N-acetyltransferase [Vibrio sp. SCSIO 43135]|uniref:GNAT family N-acetyltransferase n=1 Tax=Vibrio sp. SCSIO 43135 TaxID=2819096 RepID=UPI00207567BD|nr:GNAT family N-acetyltransferase [Vibrio sp. SCSIO 43135]USD42953.1 GNAT family N-acetyltransferase [Vibrio sp. SCSIO 43135]